MKNVPDLSFPGPGQRKFMNVMEYIEMISFLNNPA